MKNGARVTAPRWPVGATTLAAVAAVLGGVFGAGVIDTPSVPFLAVGYALGVTGVAFKSVYTSKRNAMRPRPSFRPEPAIDRLVNVAMVVSVLASFANAFFLATELAK